MLLYIARFCVLIYDLRVYESFRKFGDRNIVLAKYPFVSGRTGDLLRTTCGKHSAFPVNYQSENCIAENRRCFFVNILIARICGF